jgi:hypothetical protein
MGSVAAQPAQQILDVGSHGGGSTALLLRVRDGRVREGLV